MDVPPGRCVMRPRRLAAQAVVLVAAISTGAGALPASAQTLEWTRLAQVPNRGDGVEGMSVARVGDQIVAAYGYSNGDTHSTRIYSISTDSWTRGANAPGPRRSEGTAVADEFFVYSIGGRSGRVLHDFDRYDPRADKWIRLPDVPSARAGLAS